MATRTKSVVPDSKKRDRSKKLPEPTVSGYQLPTTDSPEGQKILEKFQTVLTQGKGEYICNDLGLWSDEKRIQAVTSYVEMGKMPKVAAITGIPANTLWSWKKYSNWWVDLERTIRGEQNNEYSAVIGDIVSSSLLAIQDRVKKGDVVYNPRTGEQVRVPVTAKTLNTVVNTLLDKRGKLVRENQADSGTAVDEKTLENKLSQLADAFKSFVASKNIPTIDITPENSDAIHDQR